MSKISLSLRLNPDLVKLIDARKTKTKNRSDVISELLYAALGQAANDKIANRSGNKIGQSKLQEQAAKASLFTMRMVELFLKLPEEKGIDVCKKASVHYKNDLQCLASEPQTEAEAQEFEIT